MWRRAATVFLLACAVSCHREEENPPVTTCEPLPRHQLSDHQVVLEGRSVALNCQLDARRSSTAWSRVDVPRPRQLAMTINSFVHVNDPHYGMEHAFRPYPHWVLVIERTRPADLRALPLQCHLRDPRAGGPTDKPVSATDGAVATEGRHQRAAATARAHRAAAGAQLYG